MATNKGLPSLPAEVYEKAVKEAASFLYERRKKLMENLGDRPYNAIPISGDEVVERVAEIRHNPQAWAGMIQEKTNIHGEPLFNKKFIAQATEIEKKIREG